MPLVTEVGLGQGHIVSDGGPSPPRKGPAAPLFRPYLLWSNSWIDQDTTWYRGRPRPRPNCIRWGPSSHERDTAPPLFGPCLLWPKG